MTSFDEIIDRRGTACLKYDFAEERGYPKDILPFWVADMDFRAPACVLEELSRRVRHGIFGYTDVKDDYRTAIISWMKTRHNWMPTPQSLVTTPGVVFAIATAIRAFTAKGDGVLLQQPVYYPFSECIKGNGRKLVNSPLVLKDGHYEIDFDDLEKKIREENVKLFLLCSPHNPAGRVWRREELARIADLCLRHDVLLFADEIHHEFVRKGHAHTVLATLSPEIAGRTITATAASKTFNLAGLQLSNIFIENERLRRAFQKEMYGAGYSQPNALGLFATQAAYEKGGPWLDALLAYLETNLQRTKAFLAQHMKKTALIEPEGTYLIWLDMRGYGLSDQALDERIIERANLWLDAGHIFGAAGAGFQRINAACPWRTLETGLTRLAKAFSDLERA